MKTYNLTYADRNRQVCLARLGTAWHGSQIIGKLPGYFTVKTIK